MWALVAALQGQSVIPGKEMRWVGMQQTRRPTVNIEYKQRPLLTK